MSGATVGARRALVGHRRADPEGVGPALGQEAGLFEGTGHGDGHGRGVGGAAGRHHGATQAGCDALDGLGGGRGVGVTGAIAFNT